MKKLTWTAFFEIMELLDDILAHSEPGSYIYERIKEFYAKYNI